MKEIYSSEDGRDLVGKKLVENCVVCELWKQLLYDAQTTRKLAGKDTLSNILGCRTLIQNRPAGCLDTKKRRQRLGRNRVFKREG